MLTYLSQLLKQQLKQFFLSSELVITTLHVSVNGRPVSGRTRRKRVCNPRAGSTISPARPKS